MKRFALVAAVVVVAVATAAVIALHSGGKAPVPLKTARFRGGISLRYPAAWSRVDWCQFGLHVTPIAVLTSTRPGPTCPKSLNVSWPPSVRLARNGVTVALAGFAPPGPTSQFKGSQRIGGEPATLTKPEYGRGWGCPAGVRRESRDAYVGGYWITATICGPDLAAGDAIVRDLFASIRFARTS